MRSGLRLILASCAIAVAVSAGGIAGWHYRAWAEQRNLEQNAYLARYFDGQSKGLTYVYVGDTECGRIAARRSTAQAKKIL